MRFLTISCNAAVDTTYSLDHLTPGAINRVDDVLPVPGGKGNNVARVLAALGQTVTATGFVGGHTGRFINDGLRAVGVEPAFVHITGETRVCLTIVERDTGRITEIREPGPLVEARVAHQLLDQLQDLAPGTDVAVIAGSIPPGITADFYRQAIEILKADDVWVALDTSGEALRCGMQGRPHLIKPNLEELAELLGNVPRQDLIARVQREVIGSVLGSDAAVLLSM